MRVLLLESGKTLGGNHTWSFHDADLTPAEQAWVAPLVAHRWDGYSVSFPALRRELASGYASVTSTHFDAMLQAALAGQVRLSTPVACLDARAFSVQYHPEAAPGPHDATGLFATFTTLMEA